MLIELSKGHKAIIDDEDYPIVAKYKWCTADDGKGHLYAKTRGGSREIRMHNLLMDTPSGLFVDHIDRDGLNNRRSNLRIATKAQNNINSLRRAKNKKSKYRGVAYNGGKWVATIYVNRRRIPVGRFVLEEDAGEAYNKTAIKLYGEFAVLNRF